MQVRQTLLANIRLRSERRRSRMLRRCAWVCAHTGMCVSFICIQKLSRLTTTANCILNQTLRGCRVEAAFLHQTCVSFSLALYVYVMLSEKWDQAMQASAGAGRIFDFITTVYFHVDTIRNFQFQPQQKITLCLSRFTLESAIFPF